MNTSNWADSDMSAYLSRDRDGWYFWNETWEALIGPYTTRVQAVRQLRQYADSIQHQPDGVEWNRTSLYPIQPGVVVIGRGPDVWPARPVVRKNKDDELYFTRNVWGETFYAMTPMPSEWRSLTDGERQEFVDLEKKLL
jgi:hypothetical protein